MKHLSKLTIGNLLVIIVLLVAFLFFSNQHQKTVASIYRIIGGLDSEFTGLDDLHKHEISVELISRGATQIKNISKAENSLSQLLVQSDQHISSYIIEDYSGNTYHLSLSWMGEGFDGFIISSPEESDAKVQTDEEQSASNVNDLEIADYKPPEIVSPEEIQVVEPELVVNFGGAKPLLEIKRDNFTYASYAYTNENERPKGQLTFLELYDVLSLDNYNSSLDFEVRELTTNELWEMTGVQVYSIGSDELMYVGYVVKDGERFFNFADELGTGGVMNFGIADMNNDGVYDLTYTHTWGSGIVRTTTEWLDLTTGEKHIIDSDFDDFFESSNPIG